MATERKICTLTATCVRACWACCSQAAETTSWKSRSNMELTAGFLFVENRNEQLMPSQLFEK